MYILPINIYKSYSFAGLLMAKPLNAEKYLKKIGFKPPKNSNPLLKTFIMLSFT